MIETISNRHQILSNGDRVWVNGPDGSSVARFHPIAGRDVHRPFAEQLTKGQCLDCSPSTDWSAFVASVEQNFGVVVGDEHKPRPK